MKQWYKKNSNSADLCHLYVLGAKLHQHLHHWHPLLTCIFSRSLVLSPDIFAFSFFRACDIEHDNLKKNQDKMKHWYDKYAMVRELKPGEKVIVLLLIPYHPL
jgi:hypothetical protein